ncbi:hypothetical protein FQA47_004045 [Oryzias melastigma]|uniref:Uncharacterized protein n=1 Tax=Oryzias melastigma TaxID=30732 RepID=A0A834CP53_ORYME|nr:hypothetical protein FQA47_004045 [Oryzias melastigma]
MLIVFSINQRPRRRLRLSDSSPRVLQLHMLDVCLQENVCVKAALHNRLPLVGHRVLGTAKQMKAVLTKKPGNNNLGFFYPYVSNRDLIPCSSQREPEQQGAGREVDYLPEKVCSLSPQCGCSFFYYIWQFFKRSCCHKKGRNGFVL